MSSGRKTSSGQMPLPRKSPSRNRPSPQQADCHAPSIWPYAVLTLAVLATFGRIVPHDFVSWDDPGHVTENPHLDPVDFSSLVRFWREPYFSHYVPLSYSLFTAEAWLAQSGRDQTGKLQFNPAVFHGTSLLLHVACVLLAYRLLLAMVRVPFAACCGAALFALHPLQVESVAWVSEQRGLLSSMFSLLALIAYLRFGRGVGSIGVDDFRAPAIENATGGARWYVLASVAYGLALLAKPSGVSVPLIAAALDLFLLKRSWRVSLGALLPWVVLAAGIFAITRQQQPETLLTYHPPLWSRPLIAGDALLFYLSKIAWPSPLVIQYPRSPQIVLDNPWVYFHGLLPVIGLGFCYHFRTRGPWLVCAAWFVAALAPVLGLFSFAYQYYSTVADRYVYLAILAPALAVAWCIRQYGSRAVHSIAAAALVLLAALSFAQAGHWRDNEALFRHALRFNPRSDAAHNNIAAELMRRQRYAEALVHLDEVLRLNPQADTLTHLNRGQCLVAVGRLGEGIQVYEEVLVRNPQADLAHENLSAAYFQSQNWTKTIEHARAALAVEPDSVVAHFNLALALDRLGRPEEAAQELFRLLENEPRNFEAHLKLASLLQKQGELQSALEHFSVGVSLRPQDNAARFDYALALAEAGRSNDALQQFRLLTGQFSPDWPLFAAHAAWLQATRLPQSNDEALRLAEAACRQSNFQDPLPLRALAAAQAVSGQWEAAQKTAQQALGAARASDRSSLATAVEGDLDKYRVGSPPDPGALNP